MINIIFTDGGNAFTAWLRGSLKQADDGKRLSMVIVLVGSSFRGYEDNETVRVSSSQRYFLQRGVLDSGGGGMAYLPTYAAAALPPDLLVGRRSHGQRYLPVGFPTKIQYLTARNAVSGVLPAAFCMRPAILDWCREFCCWIGLDTGLSVLLSRERHHHLIARVATGDRQYLGSAACFAMVWFMLACVTLPCTV